MKIIVSHDGKQHVNALLTGLSKRGVLTHFFTSLATNKLFFLPYLSQKWQSKLRKRFFTDLDNHLITHFPRILLLSALAKTEYQKVFKVYKAFDKSVANRLKTMDFDVFIGYENSSLESFKTAKQRGKITVLDMAAIHHNFQNPILEKLGTFERTEELDLICAQKEAALTYTDYILTLSSFAEYTLIQSGFPAERIFKTYLGVNQGVFSPKKHYNTEGSSETQNSKPVAQNLAGFLPNLRGLNNSQLTNPNLELYFVGLMTNRKGIPFILELHKILLERGLDVRLTLIGPIGDFTPPQQETPQYRYMSFLPHADLVKMHHDLDLFLFPSYLDSWGQVVIESMACGSPVLVSDCTGARDAVAQGGGFVLPVDDVNAWVSTIEQFYYDRSLLKKIGQQAAQIAQTYTWEAYQQQVFDALNSIFIKHTL